MFAGSTPVLVHNCGSKPLTLGIESHALDLAEDMSGYHFMGDKELNEVQGYVDGQPVTGWMTAVQGVLRRNGKVIVTIDDFKPYEGTPQEKFKRAWRYGSGQMDEPWASTEWEMFQIGHQCYLGNFEWKNVKFYERDGEDWKEIPKDDWPEPDWRKWRQEVGLPVAPE